MSGLVDEAGSNLDSARGLRRIDAPDTRPGKLRYRIVSDGGNPDIDAPTVQQYLRDDHGIETNGGLVDALEELEGIRHLEDLSSSEQAALAARLSRSSDPSATRAFVNELDTAEDVRHFLDEDTATTNQLVRWHSNPGAYQHLDSDATATDFVHVAQNGNVEEVELIVKGPDEFQNRGSVQWLETGSQSAGLKHIRQRHITGDQFYSIEGIDSIDDVKGAVVSTIKHGDVHEIPKNEGGGAAYVYQYTPESKITVIVGDNGYVVTARPGGYS